MTSLAPEIPELEETADKKSRTKFFVGIELPSIFAIEDPDEEDQRDSDKIVIPISRIRRAGFNWRIESRLETHEGQRPIIHPTRYFIGYSAKDEKEIDKLKTRLEMECRWANVSIWKDESVPKERSSRPDDGSDSDTLSRWTLLEAWCHWLGTGATGMV